MPRAPESDHDFPHIIFALIIAVFIIGIYSAVVGPHSAEADESSFSVLP